MKLNMLKTTSKTKVIAVLLIAFFAIDALALWDMLESFGLGFHEVESEQDTEIVIHFHDSGETEHESKPVDTCTLCPCCVSQVNLLVSSDTISFSLTQFSLLTLNKPREQSWFDHRFFHPPKILS